MPIGRITNRKHDQWNDQHTSRRARDSAPGITYIVTWQLHNPSMINKNHFHNKESKPTNLYSEAMRMFDHHVKYAVFVELLQYTDESITVTRRFCNLGRYRQMATNSDWVLKVNNPPYEIVDLE